MPTTPSPSRAPVPYLRAATAGLRHHQRTTTGVEGPVGRGEIDALHTHLAALLALTDALAARARAAEAPAQAAHLAAARTRTWQAAAHLHDAFHTSPHPAAATPPTPEPCAGEGDFDAAEGPEELLRLTVCRRHLALAALVRRQTTPADLHDPLHGHTHYPPRAAGEEPTR